MRTTLICITALAAGFLSGGFIGGLFFNITPPAAPLPNKTSTDAVCRDIDDPSCESDTPPAPTEATTTPPSSPEPTQATFSTAVTYAIGGTVTYPDGLRVTLTTINDSRCKPDMQCIWAGELSPQLSLEGGALGETKTQLSLGTASAPIQTTSSYTLTLETTTVDTALITITKKTAVTAAIPLPPVIPAPKVTTKPLVQVAGNDTSKPAATTPTETTQTEATFAAEVASLITQATRKVRLKESLTSFAVDNALAASAKKYSGRLLAGNYLAHIDTNGCDLTCRFNESGYVARSWGENLAMMEYDEQPSAEYVANYFMTGWQKSSGHRKNLLSPTFTNQGVGVSVAEGKVYVVVHFALPQ